MPNIPPKLNALSFFFFFHLLRQFYVEFKTFQIKYDYGLCYLYCVNIVSISKLKIVTLAPKSHPITDTQSITQFQVHAQRKINLGRVARTSSVSKDHSLLLLVMIILLKEAKSVLNYHNVSMQSRSGHFLLKKKSFAIYILKDFNKRTFYTNIEISRTKIS